MINWFINTFSSSEQAKLFAIIMSALLAVCLLLANQWFISRKAKKELIITKIEELLTTVYAYERLSLDILSNLFNDGPNIQSTLDKMAKSSEVADKIEMLCVLYFPTVSFDSEEPQSIILKVHKQFDTVEMGNKYPNDKYESYSQSTKKIQSILTPLKVKTKKIMREYT